MIEDAMQGWLEVAWRWLTPFLLIAGTTGG